MASAFASIMIYAMELVPHRIGLVGGIFYGLNFGMGGIAAAILGGMADRIGIVKVYQLCAFLPLAGLLTVFSCPEQRMIAPFVRHSATYKNRHYEITN